MTAQLCRPKLSLRPQESITLLSESFGNLEPGKHYICFIQKLQCNTFKAKKEGGGVGGVGGSSESEQDKEIRIYNPEWWISLTVKIRE